MSFNIYNIIYKKLVLIVCKKLNIKFVRLIKKKLVQNFNKITRKKLIIYAIYLNIRLSQYKETIILFFIINIRYYNAILEKI